MANINIPIGDNLTNAPLDLGAFVSDVVGFALIVAALAAFGYLVMGGILWITGGGDKGKIEEAKGRITSAIVGLAIVACSWAIFLLVDNVLGLNVANGSSSSYQPSRTTNRSTTTSPASTITSYGNKKCPYLGSESMGFQQPMCIKTGVEYYNAKNSNGNGCTARICEANGDRNLEPNECPKGDCCRVDHLDIYVDIGLCP